MAKTGGTGRRSGEELVLLGRSVSRGTAAGRALCLYGTKRQFYKRTIQAEEVDQELERFREAVRVSEKQLEAIASTSGSDGNRAKIFETHILFLSDLSLLSRIESMIREQRVNAEWSVNAAIEKYVSRYKALTDKHLQEKYIDLEDVGERVLTALGGDDGQEYDFHRDAIVVAKELNPSTLIELSRQKPLAIVTENGGWTSHTFILARELGLPAVTGIRQLLRIVESGAPLIVDGYGGKVILDPGPETVSAFEKDAEAAPETVPSEVTGPDSNLETLDGQEIILRANLDISKDYELPEKMGARGIGLYRSEFLFNQYKGFPSEDEQFRSYSSIAKHFSEYGVRIRTFDLSINQVAVRLGGREKNPALGLRGIRLSMRHESVFRTQVRALLRCSAKHNISVVLPMISDAEDVRWARRLITAEKEDLRERGIKAGDPEVGVMIEVPAAVIGIREILEESDFANVGTNDLVQYLLAVDRDNEEVADWFRTLHRSVRQCLKVVIRSAAEAGKPVLICGEMAGSPLYIPILIALGAREFSMNVKSLPRIRALVTKIAVEECRALLDEIDQLPDTLDLDERIRELYLEKWSGIEDFEQLISFKRRI